MGRRSIGLPGAADDTILSRMLIIYGAGIASILVILIGVMFIFVAPKFRDLQENETAHREEVVRQAFRAEVDRLSELARTNAVWDDAYAYARGVGSRSFTATNFSAEALRQIELSGVIILDRRGRVLYRTDAAEPAPDPLLERVVEAATKSSHFTPMSSDAIRTGVVSVAGQAAIISAAPIVRSDGSGAPAGRMILARALDPVLIERLSVQAQMPLRIEFGKQSPSTGPILRRIAVPDVIGETPAWIVLHGSHEVMSLGQQSFISLGAVTLAILLIVALVTGRVLKREIVDPVRRLADDLLHSGSISAPSATSGPRELIQLRNAFNVAISRVEEETSRHRAAAALADKARAAAEQASQAKSQFLAVMSHELRTPLNAVIGYSEILQEDLEVEGRIDSASDAARIRKAARHLLSLINDILDLSKIEAGRMELHLAPLDITALVQDVVDQVRPVAEARGNRLVVSIPDDLVPKMADVGKLRQCLLNLLSNAAKFTKDGQIELRVSRLPIGLRFDVHDTGIGISPEDALRLFEPFTQVDSTHTRSQQGTGLGLAITRRLAELMGGDLTVASTPGAGSTFTLTIAAARAPTEMAPTHDCILIIEDEPDSRELIRRALAPLPFEIRTAVSAADGLAAFEALKPILVLLDIHLPDGSGWDVLTHMRSERPDMPVLVVSVDDDDGRASRYHASEFLAKPVDRERIATAVRRLTHVPTLSTAPDLAATK